MGRAHNAASLRYSQLLRKEQTSEIHIIIQDKQNSNSSSLKISSYLTLKVGENQTEDKVKKKKVRKRLNLALSQALHCCYCQSILYRFVFCFFFKHVNCNRAYQGWQEAGGSLWRSRTPSTGTLACTRGKPLPILSQVTHPKEKGGNPLTQATPRGG